MQQPDEHKWAASPMMLQTLTAAGMFVLLSLVFGRVDLLILGLPFIIISAWALATRPTSTPKLIRSVSEVTPREAEVGNLDVIVQEADGTEMICAQVQPTPRVNWDYTTAAADGDPGRLTLKWWVNRPGRGEVGGTYATLGSAWGAYKVGPVWLPPTPVRVLPNPEPFTGNTQVPHPIGLIGANRSRHKGSGSEFADVREFQTGDRLRSIHWPLTARTGIMHTRTNYAEQDTEVHILVDASIDFGGSASGTSLDISSRAAAAISEFFLRRGDRVGVQVVGGARWRRVRTSSGMRHHRRLLDVLSSIEPGRIGDLNLVGRRWGLQAGSVALLLSPMLGRFPAQVAAMLASHGLTVIVIDTLPAQIVDEKEPHERMGLRLRLLEREAEIDALRTRGIPVVAWQGAGTLDDVLRRSARKPPAKVRAR